MGATGKFHTVFSTAQLPQPGQGAPGDVWFVNQNGQTYWIDGLGGTVQLLVAMPIPTLGPQGIQGPQGDPGQDFIGSTVFVGSWLPSPNTYEKADVVSWEGFLYLSKSQLNVSDNTQNPTGNPFWQIIGPSTFGGRQSAVVCTIDGAGSTPSTGSKGFFQIPFSCAVSSYSIIADQSGSAQFDVLWSTFAGLPNTVSIVGSAPPTLTAAQSVEADTASWTPDTFNAGDVLEIRLSSVATVTRLTLSIVVIAT